MPPASFVQSSSAALVLNHIHVAARRGRTGKGELAPCGPPGGLLVAIESRQAAGAAVRDVAWGSFKRVGVTELMGWDERVGVPHAADRGRRDPPGFHLAGQGCATDLENRVVVSPARNVGERV